MLAASVRWLSRFGLVSGALFASMVACSSADTTPAGGTPGDAPYDYVPPGKADDYRSTTGQEYALLAIDSVTLSDADQLLTGAERLAAAEELVKLKFKALSFFIYEYMASKEHEDSNYGYGGFRTTVRQQTFESLDISERSNEPGTYDFLFSAEVGGPKDLLKQLPLEANGITFKLALPILSTAEVESGSYSSKYSHFDPTKYDASQITYLDVDIEPKPMEPDAYPDYASWFSDGVLDVAIHVGGDYNAARYDLQTAKDIFARLQSDLGLTAPVATFEDLHIDSGPFTGTLDANGTPVKFEVYLLHPDMAKEDGIGYQGLIDAYKASASQRDIVIYDGHAGYDASYSGVVVHYNPRWAIPADDFATLNLPDKYQLFFFNGCKTYTTYADSLYANPKKTTANLDVITTVNFSWLSEMTRITTDLVGGMTHQENGTHVPTSYDHLLADMNKGRSWDVIYGVHGLSDNPRISPYADLSTLCGACSGNSECPGADNLCVKISPTNSVCGAACTDDTGCPDGYKCRSVAAGGSTLISGTQCMPTTQACGG